MTTFNRLNEGHVRELRAQIAECAVALSQGSVPFLEGVRRLAALSFGGENRNLDPDFALFVAIDSEQIICQLQLRALCALLLG